MNAEPPPNSESTFALPEEKPGLGRSIALVSGKGGSGKTIIASVMMEIIGQKYDIILVDADAGTGGLTFYLGLERVSGTSSGLSDLIDSPSPDSPRGDMRSVLKRILKPIKGLPEAHFLPIGNRRSFSRLKGYGLRESFASIFTLLRQTAQFTVADCRGGIDDESLAVCSAVDDIILIVETDTTSYQATRQLVETLIENQLGNKLKGFIINKVFDDPSVIARNGRAEFQCPYLAAIPFDFDALRSFFVGNIPSVHSVFSIHVQHALNKAYSDQIPEPAGRIYRFDEYQEIGFLNLDSLRGGIIVAMAILVVSALLSFYYWRPPGMFHIILPEAVAALAILGLAGSLNAPRQIIGRVVNRLITRLLYIQKH